MIFPIIFGIREQTTGAWLRSYLVLGLPLLLLPPLEGAESAHVTPAAAGGEGPRGSARVHPRSAALTGDEDDEIEEALGAFYTGHCTATNCKWEAC